MSQTQIDNRKEFFLSSKVVPCADDIALAFSNSELRLEFYQVNLFGPGAADEITDADLDPFYFTALQLQQFHDFLVQVGNFAGNLPVNAGSAFRYRLFYEQIASIGYPLSLPATSDKKLQQKYDHVIACIGLANNFVTIQSSTDLGYNFHISNGYGPGAANEITDLFLSTRFPFTAADYNGWVNMLDQLQKFVTGSDSVTPGAYQDVNVKIKNAST